MDRQAANIIIVLGGYIVVCAGKRGSAMVVCRRKRNIALCLPMDKKTADLFPTILSKPMCDVVKTAEEDFGLVCIQGGTYPGGWPTDWPTPVAACTICCTKMYFYDTLVVPLWSLSG